MPSVKTKAKARILVIVPFPLDKAGVALRRRQLKAVKLSPDTEVEFRPVKAGSTSFTSDYDWWLMDGGCFEAGLNAEEEGFDAVVVDSTADSGVPALRAVLNIPVIGPGLASQHYALMLGARFGVLTMNAGGIHNHWSWVRLRGLEPFCAAVEAALGKTGTNVANLLTGKEDEMFPLLRDAGLRAIAKGAEVLVLGSTTLHQAGEWLAQNLPVPVVNPGPLSYKMAEAAISLRHAHSRAGHPAPPATGRKDGMIHAMLEAAAAWEKKNPAPAAGKKTKTKR